MRIWGVNDYGLHFTHERTGDSRAQIRTQYPHRKLSFVLSENWGERDGNGDKHYEATDRAILETARHEAAHAVVAPIAELAMERHVSREEWVAALESVVRRLERILPK